MPPRPSVEELDLERAVDNRPLLPDELVHPAEVEHPRTLAVRAAAERGPRRLGVDRDSEGDQRAGLARAHHEVHMACVEPERDGPFGARQLIASICFCAQSSA